MSPGDGVALIYDAEGCFDRATAERMMPALGDLGVRWFEAPLPDLDLEGYRRLDAARRRRDRSRPATRSGTSA